MAIVPKAVMQRRLTLRDDEALPDDADYETVNGVLFVAPRPLPLHQRVEYTPIVSIGPHVEEHRLGVLVHDADLIVDERNTYVAPDAMVCLGDRFEGVDVQQKIKVIPDLIVEILPPSSTRRDQLVRRREYARLRAPHYWVADADRRVIRENVLRDAGFNAESVHGPGGAFRPAIFPDLELDLDRVFARA